VKFITFLEYFSQDQSQTDPISLSKYQYIEDCDICHIHCSDSCVYYILAKRCTIPNREIFHN